MENEKNKPPYIGTELGLEPKKAKITRELRKNLREKLQSKLES